MKENGNKNPNETSEEEKMSKNIDNTKSLIISKKGDETDNDYSLSAAQYLDKMEGDMISNESEEDIEAKMERLIELKKKGENADQPPPEEQKDENQSKSERKNNEPKKTKRETEPPGVTKSNKKSTEESKEKEQKSKINESRREEGKENPCERSFVKIQNKKKKLELLKRRQEDYLKLVGLQRKRREDEMKLIQEKIILQTKKIKKLQDGASVSDTGSVSEEINIHYRIENAVSILAFVLKNNIVLNMLDFINKVRLNYSMTTSQIFKRPQGGLFEEEKKNAQEEEQAKQKKKVQNANAKDDLNISEEEQSENDDTFIKLEPFGDLIEKIDKSKLVEYDKFYKEQFFKNEVFKYDVDNIQDAEENEINKEMHKLDTKRRLLEKKKLKEVNVLKGLDVTDLEEEIAVIQKEYDDCRKKIEPKLDMIMNNTEAFLYKGRILGCYFGEKKEGDFPRFSLTDEKEEGAKEIIDFKVLRKEEQARRFFDYWCCMEQRKKINKFMVYSRFWCRFFIDNWIFDNLSLLIIITNTILILISDPTDSDNIGNKSDSYFLYFYTVECVLKIIAFRFVIGEDAYIKDYWNILDFFVVVVGWISFVIERALNGTKISGLAGLRAFRILRPLKTIKRLKGLRTLITALLFAIGHLGETGIVLFFFFLIFAIGGRQMWQGLFYRRCMNVNYGYLYSTQKDKFMCSFDSDCNDLTAYGMRFICAKGYRNPDQGALNFDNVLTGFVTIFVMATLEGWTDIFNYVSKTFKDKIYINPIIVFAFFHFFIFLASFYLLKLFLAVTNAEYENIEISRNALLAKKSFFELIQSKYDLKVKEKKDKKEKEKQQKKLNNQKRSDEALIELYYKVSDEAFHMNKNRRNIPILYSTVKDMYIMTNNNPEELYLQSLRIDEEESLLCKDIKRQQKEIDILIDQKREEMKKAQREDKTKGDKKENAETENSMNNSKKEEEKSASEDFQKKNKKKKNYDDEEDDYKIIDRTDKIEEKIEKINAEIIEISIDNTQKYIKEQMITMSKGINKAQQAKTKTTKKKDKKEQNLEIKVAEDLPYEKKIREKNEKIAKQKEAEEAAKQQALNDKDKLKAGKEADKSKINNDITQNEIKKKEGEDENEEGEDKGIKDALSFITELSLSKMNESLFSEDVDKNENTENNKSSGSLLSNEDSILAEKKIIISQKDEYESKSKFFRPHSILSSVIKLKGEKEIQNKLEVMRKHFNLERHLEKEEKKGIKTNLLGRKKSFLNFLKYTHKVENLNEIVHKYEQEDDEGKKNNKDLILFDPKEEHLNLSVLSYDSNLIVDKDLSLGDIKVLPKELREKETKLIDKHFLSSEDNVKNIESNKLQQLIRNSVFDRQSVNTNINLTSKEQTRYFRIMNKNLNKNLFVESREPRKRKETELDVSHTEVAVNYEDFLQAKEVEAENLHKGEDAVVNNNIKVIDPNENKVDADKNEKGNDKEGKMISEERDLIDKEGENKDKNNNIDKKETAKVNENNNINNATTTNLNANMNANANANKNAGRDKKKGGFYIFKAKSIEKNVDKYPKENSNEFLIKEENKKYTDPLTLKQESIPDNLRGKKYYLNYLYNIYDKDLKVKDNFNVDHWVNEILGKKERFIKKKPLPESTEAFYVFNDRKLNLKRYSYIHHKDYEYQENECSYLTHNLKYLPLSTLQIMPLRLRNYGRFAAGREIKPGSLGVRVTGSSLMTINAKNTMSATNSRSGKTQSNNPRNKCNLIISSSFSNHRKIMEEINYKRGIAERIFKRVNDFNYKTLARYFEEDNDLWNKFIDDKKRQDKLNDIELTNRAKQSRLEVKTEIPNIQIYDLKTNSRPYVKWSGSDVLAHKEEDDERKKWNRYIDYLESFAIIIWSQNPAMQNMEKMRYSFYVLASNDIFDIFILSIVLINSVFMALDGNLIKPETYNSLNITNYIFNSIFIFEYVVKFIGFGPIVYYSDAFTYLDTLIIAFACVDMATPTTEDDGSVGAKKSVSSQLSFLRVFRIFRVVRLAKILRRLKGMKLIIVSITKAIANVAYIICILLMFILIFVLLGMSLLSGNMHYQSFLNSLYTTYEILTLEGWNKLLIEMWPMNNLCFFYFLAWIIFGNFILINLFISILLQSFGEGGEEENDDYSEMEQIEKMYTLPDYLYSIKTEKNIKKEIKNEPLKKKNNTDNFLNNSESAILKDNTEASHMASSQMNTSTMAKSEQSSDEEDGNEEEESEEEDNADNADNSASNNNTNNNTTNPQTNTKATLTGIEKKMKDWKRINKLFRKNECENSLYFLSQTNNFRILCLKFVTNKWFDRFILICILLSTARLILDTFIHGYIFALIFEVLDAVFNVIFLLEAIFKVCALGFAFDEGSYLSDNWNKMDCLIVICSLFDFYNLFLKYLGNSGSSSSSLQFLKVLRLLRTLRPLRFISHNIQLKLIISSLFESIVPITFALFILLVVYYIFSIVGISLFYNSLHNCYVLKDDGTFDLAISSFENNLADYEVTNDMSSISTFCANKYNGIMDTGPTFKFSNILTSIITSYILSTLEGWPDIMDSYNIYSDFYGIFFLVYILVVSYFFINLFTGIMFRYFNEAYKRETKLCETDKKAPKYYDFLNQIYKSDSHYCIWVHPRKGTFRFYVREFCDSAFLDNFIMICIGLNMISMAINYENCAEWYSAIINVCNYVFSGIFIAECLIKLLGYGPSGYFHLGWNQFDCFVVVSSIVDIAVANIEGIDAAFLKSFQIIRVLRVLRVTRVLRLVKSLKGLEKLIQTLSWSLDSLLNVCLLMIIIYAIFSILGCFFFEDVFYENYQSKFTLVNNMYNLDNFYTSFLLIFRVATGEGWPSIMNEYCWVDDNTSEAYSYILFIVGNFATGVIMINLFLMVTLQQYDEFTGKSYNPIEKYEIFLSDFNAAWNKNVNSDDGWYRIKKYSVINLFNDLSWKKLNFPDEGKLEAIKKYTSELKLRTDNEDFVYYHEVIYKLIFKQMGSQIDRLHPDNALILKTEKRVYEEIKGIVNGYMKKSMKKAHIQKNLIITFNPLTSHLYFKVSYLYFRSFLNFYKENLELMKGLEEEQQATNTRNKENTDNKSNNILKDIDNENENKNENNNQLIDEEKIKVEEEEKKKVEEEKVDEANINQKE